MDSGPLLEDNSMGFSDSCVASNGEEVERDEELGADAEDAPFWFSIGLSGSADTCAASRSEAREEGRLPLKLPLLLPSRDLLPLFFFVFSRGRTCPKGAWRYFPREDGRVYS